MHVFYIRKVAVYMTKKVHNNLLDAQLEQQININPNELHYNY
jgi:hypothetical protein